MNLFQWIKYRIELFRRKQKVCKYCYGKGYSTELKGQTLSADFPGDKSYTLPPEVNKNICKQCKP